MKIISTLFKQRSKEQKEKMKEIGEGLMIEKGLVKKNEKGEVLEINLSKREAIPIEQEIILISNNGKKKKIENLSEK